LDNRLEPSTGEAYADDLTIIFKMGEDEVRQILKMLKDFEMVSGLEINIGKTQLMVAGCDKWRAGMKVMGIEIVDKVTILGVTIDRKLEALDTNWDKAIVKMRRLAGYWSLFGLSITGRVMVAKTYILSQCIYLMGSLPMSREIGDRINEVLVNYVKGRDRLIERRRQFLCTSLGGYGLVDVNLMNVCMKAVWIERLKGDGLKNDYMAAIIWNGEHGLETWRVNKARVGGKGFQIMEDIVRSWTLFKEKFLEWGSNINLAEIFGNEVLLNDGRCIESLVFSMERYQEVKHIVRGKSVGEICNPIGNVMDKISVERILGIRLSWAEYFRLRTAMTEIEVRFPRKMEGIISEVRIEDFVMGRRKGCKRYRKIMEGKWSTNYMSNTPMNIAAGITLWGEYMEQMGREGVEAHYKLWSCAMLEADFKDFLFKLVHGKLYLNNQAGTLQMLRVNVPSVWYRKKRK
jgi:hypothetical protein